MSCSKPFLEFGLITLTSMPFIMGVKRGIERGTIEPDEVAAKGEELVLWLVFVLGLLLGIVVGRLV